MEKTPVRSQASKLLEIAPMKILVTALVAGVLLSGLGFAQEPTPAQTTNPAPQQNPAATQAVPQQTGPSNNLRISPGSVIPVKLTKTIDAKKAKTGDAVEAKVTQDMKTQSGEVLVPKDTQIVGHITEAQARSKEQKESELGIAFDHAVVKDKGDVPLPMSIQAIVAPPSLNANNNAGAEAPSSPDESPSPGMSQANPGGGARGSAMGGAENQSQAPMPPPSSGTQSGAQTGARPAITGQTQGVVGNANWKLSAATNSNQGSLVSSEKENVKLESGTFMLLRVNP